MTASSAINAGSARVHYTLLIDGIPVLFGTKAGLVLSTTGILGAAGPATLTSVAAFATIPQVGGKALNHAIHMVTPGDAKCVLRKSSTWNKYFEPRRTGTYLTTAVTAAATSLTLHTASLFAVNQVIYIDREAILVTALTSGQPSTVTRNYCALAGSKAAIHLADAPVGPSPASLHKRTAEIRMWTSDTDHALLGRFVISNCTSDDEASQWQLSFKGFMEALDVQVAKGFRATKMTDAVGVAGGAGLLELQFADSDVTSWLTNSSVNGHVMAVSKHGWLVAPIVSFSGAQFPRVNFYAGGQTRLARVAPEASVAANNVELRRVVLLNGPPMVAALQVLLSDRGDGNNHATYDVLYGRTTTGTGAGAGIADGEQEVRFGAAIPPDLLDMTTLTETSLLNDPGIGFSLVLGGDGPMSLLEVLENVAFQLKGYWYENSDGKLSFARMSGVFPTTAAAAATLTESNILREKGTLRSTNDETEVIHTFQVECNYDYSNRRFDKVNIVYQAAIERFRGVGKTLKVKYKGLIVNLPEQSGDMVLESVGQLPAGVSAIFAHCDRWFYRTQNGLRKYVLAVAMRYYALRAGQRATLTHSLLTAFDGSTVNAMSTEIVKISKVDTQKGRITLEVSETWSGRIISPTGKISSWPGGVSPYTITFATSTKYGGGTTPGRMFAIGWKVKILDKSASPPFSTASGVYTITGVTDTTITVTGAAPAFTPAAGDVVVQADYDNATSTVASASYAAGQRDHLFLSDANGRLGASDAPSHLLG